MSIRINTEKCVGCGRCGTVCPGSLLDMADGKARIKYPKDCWGCVSCVKECKAGAIEFFLGADMGGGDTYMQVEKDGDFLHWKFYNEHGLLRTITVNSTSANQY